MNSDLETTKLTTIHMFMFLVNRNISVVETDKKVFIFILSNTMKKILAKIVYALTG